MLPDNMSKTTKKLSDIPKRQSYLTSMRSIELNASVVQKRLLRMNSGASSKSTEKDL